MLVATAGLELLSLKRVRIGGFRLPKDLGFGGYRWVPALQAWAAGHLLLPLLQDEGDGVGHARSLHEDACCTHTTNSSSCWLMICMHMNYDVPIIPYMIVRGPRPPPRAVRRELGPSEVRAVTDLRAQESQSVSAGTRERLRQAAAAAQRERLPMHLRGLPQGVIDKMRRAGGQE